MYKRQAALGPFAGGLIASLFGISWTLAAAIAVLTLAIIPLLASGESKHRRQRIDMSVLSLRKHRHILLAQFGSSIDTMALAFIWPLIMGVFIFTEEFTPLSAP